MRVRRGFTLAEVLVVTAIISLLAAAAMPAFRAARERAKAAQCLSNLRQLHLANLLYSGEHNGAFVPAAPDIFEGFGGRIRWHGRRETPGPNTEFDPRGSPLYAYFAGRREVKVCPAFRLHLGSGDGAFEAGTGGYGYNQQYIGATNYKYGFGPLAAATPTLVSGVENPAETVMFTDAAMPVGWPKPGLVEYSFCEPPFFHSQPGEQPDPWRPEPSIHFRHLGTANVVWCDGHVSAETNTFTKSGPNVYGGDNDRWQVGWFGPQDNSLFDVW